MLISDGEEEEIREFYLNGQPMQARVRPRRTLLKFLREELNLTGTKEGCGHGHCGACSVIIDGLAHSSCLIALGRVAGRNIITIEGIGTPDNPHPIQQALVEAGAIQCGFCTPGMVVSAKALLDANPNSTRTEVIRALSRNLCRCTGYAKIVEGVLNAARMMRGEPLPAKSWEEKGLRPEASTAVVGASVIRPGAMEKALGRVKYGADLRIDGLLHLKVLRSPHHRARILKIDTSGARAMSGVVATFTAKDIPGANVLSRPREKVQDQPLLVEEMVRRVGDPVALVVAQTEAAAQAALGRIKVYYQPLPPILDARAALALEAPRVHEKGNLLFSQRICRGNVKEGFAQAEVIVENSYSTSFLEHAYLEPEVAIAYPDEKGRSVIETPFGQVPHFAQEAIARVLGTHPERVRLKVLPTGGSFGGKSEIFLQAAPALAAYKLGRPVRLRYDREESFAYSTKRHPAVMNYRTGATKHGKLAALQAEILLDTGAYAAAGSAACQRAALHATGPYCIPNVLVEARAVYTNNPVASTMRGPGVPQVTFAVESQMDELAEKLDMDPLELRLINALDGSSPTAHGQNLGPGFGLKETLSAVAPYYREMEEKMAKTKSPNHLRRGLGLACMWYGLGTKMPYPAQVRLELLPEGKIGLFTGAAEMGQGITTALAQMAAEELNLPFEFIRVTNADTDLTPPGAYPTASRQTMYSGHAVRQAAAQLQDALIKLAAEILEDSPGNVRCQEGQFYSSLYPDQKVPLARIAALCKNKGIRLTFSGSYDTPLVGDLDPETGQGIPYLSCASATQLAEVEVNTRTGTVRVLKMVAAQDVGRVINPRDVEAQMEGAIMMGLGMALKEEFIPGETVNFSHYRIPTMRDLPEIVPLFVEVPEPAAPFGVKGLGECASLGTAPAIINALARATGVRVFHLPATAKRIREALEKAEPD